MNEQCPACGGWGVCGAGCPANRERIERRRTSETLDPLLKDDTLAMLEHKRASFITTFYGLPLTDLQQRVLNNLNERIMALGGRSFRYGE